jgi:serine O-acetyltransferase
VDDRAGDVEILRRTLSVLRRDFAVNAPNDARTTIVIWRLGQASHTMRSPVGFMLRRVHGVLDFLWTRAIMGAELPRSVSAGPGLVLHHAGRGVIMFPTAVLGDDVTLFHQVTLGIRGSQAAPRLETGAYVGAGAKVLGDITLGTWCRVGANAVVTTDVAPRTTVVGIPARPL